MPRSVMMTRNLLNMDSPNKEKGIKETTWKSIYTHIKKKKRVLARSVLASRL
jgi:hypothetical protein